MDRWWLVVLQLVAFGAPTLAFARLLWRTQAEVNRARAKTEERGHDRQTSADFDEQWGRSLLDAPLSVRRDVVWDIVLVGVGMAAGAAAGILPLFIAVEPPVAG